MRILLDQSINQTVSDHFASWILMILRKIQHRYELECMLPSLLQLLFRPERWELSFAWNSLGSGSGTFPWLTIILECEPRILCSRALRKNCGRRRTKVAIIFSSLVVVVSAWQAKTWPACYNYTHSEWSLALAMATARRLIVSSWPTCTGAPSRRRRRRRREINFVWSVRPLLVGQ